MLGSINPLGERGRRSRWAVTVAAFVAGSAAAGLAAGLLLGAAGSLVVSHVSAGVRAVALAAVVAVGAAWEGLIGRHGLPGPRRQVNEDWLARYRGWVYGLGFGLQLGLGLATIVTTSAIYAVLAAAFLSGSVARGAVIGATFGVARALPLLAGHRIRRAADLLTLDSALRRWDARARLAGVGVQLAVAAAILVPAAAR